MAAETRETISGNDILELVSKFSHDKESVSYYCRMQGWYHELECLKVEAEAALSSMPDREKEIVESLKDIAAFKKDLLKVFVMLHGHKFVDTTTPESNDYLLEGVAADEDVITFREYHKQFSKYRFEFYSRSSNIDSVRLEEYRSEANTLEGFNEADESKGKFPLVALTFNFNGLQPYDMALKDLEHFTANVTAYIKSYYHTTKRHNPSNHADVLRDNSGRMTDREHPSNIFDRWERYLKAYDLSRQGEKKLAAIAKETKDIGKKSRYFHDEINAASAANKDIAEAERLIISASKGTFPY